MSFEHPNVLHTAFAAAFASKDIEGLIGLYEGGAVQVQTDGSLISGPDELRIVFGRLLAAGMSLEGEQQKCIVSDDIALTSTRYYAPGLTGADALTTVVTAEVSRRQPDGKWRVVIDAPFFANVAY